MNGERIKSEMMGSDKQECTLNIMSEWWECRRMRDGRINFIVVLVVLCWFDMVIIIFFMFVQGYIFEKSS